ncbi:MAG: hypothetical protein VW644_08230 [Alphaproteobacteria bacterium]|jgi:hypothetical protein
MRKSLMMLVTLAGAAAFATAAHAGDAKSDQAAADYSGCGGSASYLNAEADTDAKAAEKAELRAKVEAIIDSALAGEKTAAAPAQTAIPASGG